MPKRLFLFMFLTFLLFSIRNNGLFALTQAEQEAEWRIELTQTEADIAKWQSILDNTKANTASLKQEVALLNAKIQQAKAFIKKKNIAIAQLEVDIAQKNAHIKTLEQKINDGHDSLAQLLRKTNEVDAYSLPEVVLANKNISDFWSDVDTFQSINRSLENLFIQIRATKNLTEKEKVALGKQKDKETDTKASAEADKKKVEANEKQKEYLIQVNKTQEKTYAQVIAEQQAKATAIKAKLFKLAGGSAAIPFGTALAYAQNAGNQTGVEPSFLLAVLTQESNLGANVGKCYLTDVNTGAGVSVDGNRTWSNLMKAPRDTAPFLDITNRLGFSPLNTVVSCPIPSAGGYGGAMGPAQFIASTWVLIEDRLKQILGHEANPLDAQDAFMAAATYLSDRGASGTSYSAEIRAACKYYGSGGSNCLYGRNVMNLKNSIQSDIDYLNQYGVSRR